MAETLEQCTKRLRELALSIPVLSWDGVTPRPPMRISSHPGWLASTCFACLVGDVPEGLREVDGTAGLDFLKDLGEPLERAPEYDVPTTQRMEPSVVEVDEGCEGCDCGECPGRAPTTRPGPPELVEEVGQTVFRASGGDLVTLDPKYAPLVEGLSLSLVHGVGAVLGRLDGEPVVAVMIRRSDVVARAKEWAAEKAAEAEDARA